MNYKKMLMLVISLAAMVLPLTGCGASVPDDSKFPTGRFVKSTDPEYGLIFNDDGTFSVFTMGNTTLVSGTYSVEDDIFIEESNDGGCSSPMRFKYTFDGTNLTFQYAVTPIDDFCVGRRNDFNNVTYILAEK